jgi:hypothetical protein
MKLVTVATHSERYYPYLKLSAEKYGHELITLGWGTKWKGYGWKFELMRDYLKTVDSDEIVCFVDAYDVVVLQDPHTIEDKFRKNVDGDMSKIFISREQYSHNGIENIFLSYIQGFVFTKCDNEYINTGTYIGTAGTLYGILERVCEEFKCAPDSDDQRLIQDYCVKYKADFVFDMECDIFLVINSTISAIKFGEYDITFNNKTLIYKNSTYPAFFHGNGYTDFDYIISELGYDTSIFKADGESKSKYVWSRIITFLPLAFQKLWIFILLFLVVIVYVYRKSLEKLFNIKYYRKK